MNHAPRLPKEVFTVLAAIAWADGKLAPEEAAAIHRAATDEGLAPDQLEEIERTVNRRVELGEADLSKLSREQALLLYAMSTWVAALNRGVGSEERKLLDVLRAQLSVEPRLVETIESVLSDLLLKPSGMRPARFDLAGLRSAISTVLEAGIASAD